MWGQSGSHRTRLHKTHAICSSQENILCIQVISKFHCNTSWFCFMIDYLVDSVISISLITLLINGHSSMGGFHCRLPLMISQSLSLIGSTLLIYSYHILKLIHSFMVLIQSTHEGGTQKEGLFAFGYLNGVHHG